MLIVSCDGFVLFVPITIADTSRGWFVTFAFLIHVGKYLMVEIRDTVAVFQIQPRSEIGEANIGKSMSIEVTCMESIE